LDVCVDLSGSSPLTQTGMADFAPVRAVIDATQRKRAKYEAKCATIGYEFLPFSFSSLGELEDDAITLVKRFRKFSMTQDIETRDVVYIFNRIGFAVAKGVGAQIVSRLRTNPCRHLFYVGGSSSKEVDIGLGEGCDKPFRPADMLLYSWYIGLDVCVDMTRSSPLMQTGMVDSVAGHVVTDAAHRKRNDAMALLKQNRKFSMTEDIGARAAAYIFNRINFVVAKRVGLR
nr:putative reverse transcriptase domain-containing protein [Tanacetum cinerariifolium]